MIDGAGIGLKFSKRQSPIHMAALQRLLARFGGRGIAMGGVAASLLGRPRLTADVNAYSPSTTQRKPTQPIFTQGGSLWR